VVCIAKQDQVQRDVLVAAGNKKELEIFYMSCLIKNNVVWQNRRL